MLTSMKKLTQNQVIILSDINKPGPFGKIWVVIIEHKIWAAKLGGKRERVYLNGKKFCG